MKTIGEVSKMFGLPVSTLRYYDRLGLLPGMERKGGKRQFGPQEIEALRVIECLKKSGLELRDIQAFMDMVQIGPETYPQRRKLFEHQLEEINRELEALQRTKAMLEFKCWYYKQAQRDGNEDGITRMIDEHSLPQAIQAAYDLAHSAGPGGCFCIEEDDKPE